MNLEKFLPSKTYVLITSLSVDEVKTRIAQRIEPNAIIPNANFNDPLERQYEGRLFNNSFQINQKIVGSETLLHR